jgi:hypothetical protein
VGRGAVRQHGPTVASRTADDHKMRPLPQVPHAKTSRWLGQSQSWL